ncbi:MAG TPA: hypothetical protein PK440_04595 [Candidatus Accumulibacter phosphatis]|nr:MAG: Serine/threonine exchanger SteT [Candidatus Accumulibacter sp. SK-11]HRL77579.1 hypothetical protein [Candidatus Accumulibacter phosphatis]HRQ94278.1 hypothetical protein [Candidatus Accumulibacter phosphatis]
MTAAAGGGRLGLFSASTRVVASMPGSGVFTTSGFLLADLKSPWLVLLAWFVGSLLAACGALCHRALARRLPESGGEYFFLSRTRWPAAGTMAGCIPILVGFAAPLAAASLAVGDYVRDWLPDSSPQPLGSALLCAFAAPLAADGRRQSPARPDGRRRDRADRLPRRPAGNGLRRRRPATGRKPLGARHAGRDLALLALPTRTARPRNRHHAV